MKNTSLWGVMLTGLSLTISGQWAHAVGDEVEGQKKFYTCVGCHGIQGYSNAFPTYAVPKLGGQHPEYLVSALKAYQNGSRKHGSMEGNTAGLSEQDYQNLAAYLGRFREMNASNAIKGNATAGKEKAAACGACHGEDGNSSDPNNPRLAGQYESYLIKTLQQYKSGTRKNAVMNSMAEPLTEGDIEDISAYYASQKKGLKVVSD